MAAKIVPTVGRVVHCHNVSRHGVIPGIIIHVLGDTPDAPVNVLALGDGSHEPLMTPINHVRILNPDEPPDIASETYCSWMPYQMGQAAKTEQLEAQLKAVRRTRAWIEVFHGGTWLKKVGPRVGATSINADKLRAVEKEHPGEIKAQCLVEVEFGPNVGDWESFAVLGPYSVSDVGVDYLLDATGL